MATDKTQLMLEAERRGLLDSKNFAMLEEARKRGLMPQSQVAEASPEVVPEKENYFVRVAKAVPEELGRWGEMGVRAAKAGEEALQYVPPELRKQKPKTVEEQFERWQEGYSKLGSGARQLLTDTVQVIWKHYRHPVKSLEEEPISTGIDWTIAGGVIKNFGSMLVRRLTAKGLPEKAAQKYVKKIGEIAEKRGKTTKPVAKESVVAPPKEAPPPEVVVEKPIGEMKPLIEPPPTAAKPEISPVGEIKPPAPKPAEAPGVVKEPPEFIEHHGGFGFIKPSKELKEKFKRVFGSSAPTIKAGERAIETLNNFLKEAKPAREQIETAYTKERGKRIAQVEKVINEIGGEKGYAIALSKLKGELLSKEAKPRFEPLKAKLSQQEIDDLYNMTFKHPYLDNWEKLTASNGLTMLFEGEIPQASRLVLLEEIYGKDLIKNILAKRALGLKIADNIVEVINLPRALLASSDFSAFLRQGIVEVAAHPVISLKAMGKTFQFAFSSKNFKNYFDDLYKDPLYPVMRKSGLGITDPERALASGREEVFTSRLLQKTPILGHIFRFSERAYVGFLNKLRVDVFKLWADELISKGYSPVKDAELFKSAADVVNTFTGRASLGRLNRITPELNTIFFSPRLNVARFNALNPVWYMKQPKAIRIKAIKDFAKFVSAGLVTTSLMKASGLADVEVDLRSSDFGKIRIGHTRYDIWGGFQQWARVFAQVASGQRKNTSTGEIVSLTKDEYPFTTRYETVLRFIEGKLAPVPALIKELMAGAKKFTGEDMDLSSVAWDKLVPMYIQDIADAYKDGGLGNAVPAGLAAAAGVGVQTYGPKLPKSEQLYEKYRTVDVSPDIANFYEKFNKARVWHDAVIKLRKERKIKEAGDLQKEHPESRDYNRLNAQKRLLDAIDESVQKIYDSKTMSEELKTERINWRYSQKVRIAENALEKEKYWDEARKRGIVPK